MNDRSNPKSRRGSPLKGKGGLVMAAVVLGLGGFIWYDARHGRPKEPDAQAQAWEFVGIKRPENVTRVEVRGGAEPYTLAKRGEAWRLTAPVSAPAAKQTVEDALKSLLDATVGETYRADRVKASELKKYGLDKPSMEIVLTDGGQRVVQVGGEHRQGNFYAREKSDQRVFVLTGVAINAFKGKKPEDFRDKSLLGLGESDKVRRVTLDGPKGRVEVERRGNDWAMVRPMAAPADSSDVNTLLSDAKETQATSFVAGGAKELAKYGLDRPRLTLTVVDDQGAHTLLFGSETPDKEPKVYALRRGEQDVMLAPKETLEKLDRGADDLHSRTMLGFDTTKAKKVTVRAPAGTYKLEKRGNDWWVVKPYNARADQTKVTTILTQLQGPAIRFVEPRPTDPAKYGLQTPQLEATIQVEGEPVMRYFLGSVSPAKEKAYYARTSKSTAVFEVSEFVFTDLNQKPDELKQK